MARPRLHSTLFDLPVPVLDKLLAHIDDQSLVELSATCREFNTKALNTFFDRYNMGNPKNLMCTLFLSNSNHPPMSLKAIRRALSVHKIQTIYYFFWPGTEKLFADVHDMTQLVGRLAHVRKVNFYFYDFDQWARNADGNSYEMDPVAWKRAMWSLLDKVLDKGCEKLYVTGGDEIPTLYPGELVIRNRNSRRTPQPQSDLPIANSTTASSSDISIQGSEFLSPPKETVTPKPRRLFSIFKKKVRKAPAATQLTTRFESVKPALTTPAPSSLQPCWGSSVQWKRGDADQSRKMTLFHIHSKMLLDEPLFDWTISTILVSASTLTTLSFKCSSFHTIDWRFVLKSLYLPHLQDFELMASHLVAPITGADYQDLHHFLARHSTIKILSIYGLSQAGSPSTPLSAAILPNLVDLKAHPHYVTWFLSPIKLYPTSMPGLTSITIRSEYFQLPGRFRYAQFDDAILFVAEIRRKVKLSICFTSQPGCDIHSWMQSHVNMHTPPSPITSLNHVQDLVISLFLCADLPIPALNLLPTWLNLFPDLRSLKFEEVLPEVVQRMEDLNFKQILANGCPKMERLYNSKGVELSLHELRGRNRAMEDGSGGPDSGLGRTDDPIVDGSG